MIILSDLMEDFKPLFDFLEKIIKDAEFLRKKQAKRKKWKRK